MSLEKLIGADENLAVKPFVSLLYQYSKGKFSAQNVIDSTNKMLRVPISKDDEADILELLKQLDGAADKLDFMFGLLVTLGLKEYDDTIMLGSEVKSRYKMI